MLDKNLQTIHSLLIQQGKTIAVAESCTGGQLSGMLTRLPDSSKYFLLGAITYSNKSKEIILGIPKATIAKSGAVSRPVAILMAQNIRKKVHANFGLSITGIAGPAGATPTKTVGTVYICLSMQNRNNCRKFIFSGSRQSIRKQAVQEALHLLCAHLSP